MWVGVTLRVAAAITLHLTRHAPPQLAHALRPHPHEGAGCDLGQWRRWGEATPALGVLEALFCILPRRCRPTLARVGLQGGARAHQEQPVDGAHRGSRMQCEWVPCVGSPCNGALLTREPQQIVKSCHCNCHFSGE